MSDDNSKCTLWKQTLLKMIFACCLTVIILNLSFSIDSVLSDESSLTTFICPSSCYCDENGEYVSCVGDGLWNFPMEIPNTTVRLELRNYHIKDLNLDEFTNLVKMEELKLQQSEIENIDNSTFLSNAKLERLDLSQNLLSTLSSSVFSNLINLRYLDLSTNKLIYVDEAFLGLSNLEQLNLRENKLQELTINTFTGLHKVQYLNLDANNISEIEVGTFQYLTNLAHLIISNNPLTTLSRLDFFGSRLQYIDISHVGLDRIPQSLTRFVRDLRLAKNNLTHISAGDFDSYPYLGLLVLDDNCVSEIENDALGRQEYLMRLWLNGNCLTKVPPNLPPSLLALYMEENKLTELLSYSFKGLVHLEQLFLQRNEIQHMISCAFCDLVSLKSLDLQANKIENLTSGVFDNLDQLQTLDLSQNNLKHIDSRCFESLSRLNTLQMSRVHAETHADDHIFDSLSSLQTFEIYDSPFLVHSIVNSTRMLHGLRSVQELNIMHNKIQQLRSDFPSFFPSLKTIKLSGNKWYCDENIKWLSNWIKQSNVQFYSSYNIRCAAPQNVLFKPLMMLVDSDFTSTTTAVTEVLSVVYTTFTTPSILTSDITVPYSTERTSLKLTPSDETTAHSEMTEIFSKESNTNLSSVDNFGFTHAYEYKYIKDSKKDTSANDSLKSPFIKTDKSVEVTTISSTEKEQITSQDSHFVSFKQNELPAIKRTKTENISVDEAPRNISSLQTISPQRRVLSSRLRTASQTADGSSWDQATMIVLSGTISGGCLLFVIIALTAFTCFRLRHRYQPVKHKNMRRSSSISYYAQKDEVSIVTLTEGTVGLKTTSHVGVGNKLYYIMENGGNTPDISMEAIPDSQLQELLPQTSNDSALVY